MFKRETIENGFSPHFFENIARYMKNHIGGLPLSLSQKITHRSIGVLSAGFYLPLSAFDQCIRRFQTLGISCGDEFDSVPFPVGENPGCSKVIIMFLGLF